MFNVGVKGEGGGLQFLTFVLVLARFPLTVTPAACPFCMVN